MPLNIRRKTLPSKCCRGCVFRRKCHECAQLQNTAGIPQQICTHSGPTLRHRAAAALSIHIPLSSFLRWVRPAESSWRTIKGGPSLGAGPRGSACSVQINMREGPEFLTRLHSNRSSSSAISPLPHTHTHTQAYPPSSLFAASAAHYLGPSQRSNRTNLAISRHIMPTNIDTITHDNNNNHACP